MKKKILIALACVLVVATGAGIWGYNYFFKVDDRVRGQLEEEFSRDFFSFDDLDIEEASREVSDMEEKDLEIADSNNPQEKSESQEKLQNEVSQETIEIKYTQKFERLESTALERIDILFENAKNEYNQQKKENKLNKTQLARKYLQAASILEESVDARFNQLLKEMEGELQQHQLPTDLLKEAKTSYTNAIKEKKSNMLSKLDGII